MNDVQDLVNAGKAGYTQQMADARNFPGHERAGKLVMIDCTMELTANAPANAASPCWAPGPFADGWELLRSTLKADPTKEMTHSALAIGNIGSITTGKTKGGTFGTTPHRVDDVLITGYMSTASGLPLYQYGVSHILNRVRVENCNVRRVHWLPNATGGEGGNYMPFDKVDFVQITNCTWNWTQPLSYIGSFGLFVQNNVDKFITGGNTFTVTPRNLVNGDVTSTESVLNPVYIAAKEIEIRGKDKIITKASAAATKHLTTNPVIVTSMAGELPWLDTETETPLGNDPSTNTNVRAYWHYALAGQTTATRMAYRPGSHTLIGTPTVEKTGVRLDREVVMRDVLAATFTGNWTNATVDSTAAKYNQQGQRRIVYGSAAPTAGDWNAGDIVIPPVPSVRVPVMWRCIASGTPGTWETVGLADVSYGDAVPTTGTYTAGHLRIRTSSTAGLGKNIGWVCIGSGTPGTWQEWGQAGYRQTSGPPTFNAQNIGEEAFDATNKKWYKAVSTGSGAADWVALN